MATALDVLNVARSQIGFKEGINNDFYNYYERLQVLKEACSVLSMEKDVHAAGEGVSIQIAAATSNTQIQRETQTQRNTQVQRNTQKI